MTITGTSTHHDVVVAWARHDIEIVTGPNPFREKAERVLREWHSYEAMTGVEIADVLAAYYPDPDVPEPVAEVADPDPWCEIVESSRLVVDAMVAEDLAQIRADADVIVAEVLDGPKPEQAKDRWQQFLTVPCPSCKAAVGEECQGRSARWSHIHRRNASALVEVTSQPAEVWDDSVPPGGYVCATCRVPVESEPCPEHGPVEVTDAPKQVQP